MSFVIAILVLGVLVFVHELGHFLVAKFFHVGVLEFALGFGPVVASWQRGETTYRIRAIPLGGFVRMAGDDPRAVATGQISGEDVSGASAIEGTQGKLTPQQEAMVKDESRWFLKQSYLPRCAIVLAGPMFNFIFAWVIASGIYAVKGLPHIQDGPVTVGSVQEEMAAAQAGIRSGDRVISVNGVQINTFKELVELVRGSEGRSLRFVVDRQKGNADSDGKAAEPQSFERLTIAVTPSSGITEFDVLEGTSTAKPTYRIGIGPAIGEVTYEQVALSRSMKEGLDRVVELSLQTLRVIKALLTGLLDPTKTIGGPIEIVKQTAANADDLVAILSMMIFLNVTLGVMNLLPIPVLDGGHLTLFTLELLRGKPLSLRVQEAVMQVGMSIVLLLMVFAIGNDLVKALPWKWGS
jgi:regulator of sigma E protease